MAAGMGDETRRLSPGDRWRPTASVLNGYQDAADYVESIKRSGGAIPGAGAGPQPAVMTVRNDSGDDCERFAVLGIDRPIFLPDDSIDAFTSRVAVSGVEPTVEDHRGRFVVLLRPLAKGEMGPAAVAGAVQVRVYVNSRHDRCCDVIEPVTSRKRSVTWGRATPARRSCGWKKGPAREKSSGPS